MQGHADDLARRRTRDSGMGGEEAVARQHAAGKLTARERIDKLFDKDTFTEIGIHATHAALIDDVIDPRETRPTLIRALEMAKTKRVDRPWRGVMPV
jgi:methylmalonyl-CoA decarboxylase subunit alpha